MAARGDTNTDTRIAIVGMSAILPSGENVRESWETIRQGLDCLADLPADRVDVTAYYHPDKTVKDKIYCTRGGFIPEYDFDAREFGLNMFQMEDSDANQTISLLKVKEALDDANIPAFSKNKKNIGCVLGIGGGQKSCHEFYSRLNYVVVEKVLAKMGMPQEDIDVAVEKYKANFPEWRLDSFPGMLGNVTAGRCSNTFNMEGMNCVVDAACASSLIAVKVAIEELLYGDADAMIAGATCTDNAVGMYMSFSKTPVFSTDQSVKAYDESTKGMLIGEGSCMMVLKRYADAVRDGDDIHAVIRACASSSDGKAAGIYTPTISGQEEALRRAYARAGVDPSTVTLVEGHGTGTPVGDKIELTALRNLFQKAYGDKKEQVAIGSIKSQIGHLKAVAGFAGLVKVVLALKHKTLPQTINVENPPNLVDGTKIQDSPLYINTMNRPWFTPPGVPRRAGISSFGFGGANYHAVLEEYEPEQEKPYRMNMLSQPVLLHAATPQQLKSTCAQQLSELEAAVSESATLKNADNIRFYKFIDQFKLSGQVPQSNARVGFLVLNIAEAIAALKSIVAQFEKAPAQKTWVLIRAGVSYRETGVAPGSVAALFSGQGSQYTHMFSDVAMNWPQFRETVASMDTAQQQVMAGSDYERVSSVLYPRNPYTSEEKQDNKKISETIYSQPTTLACSVGAFEIFKNAGFSPDFCAGHSLGEFSALYAAGCVDRESLFKLVCERAKAMRDSPKKKQGAMAAIIGPNAESIKLSGNEVWLGNCNSPSQTVITGASDSIQAESARLKAEGYRVIPLACDGAFHSPHMEAAEKSFGQVLSQTSVTSSPSPKFFSNVTGNQATGSAVKQNLSKHMTSSVQFLSQVKNMHKAGAKVFVEFGPKQVLSKLVEEILKGEDVISVAVNASSSKDSDTQLREAAVKLAVAGVPLSNFDPWELRDPKTLVASKKKRTTLRLSAATYVSKKTLDARQKIMDDGRSITYAKSATSTPVTVVDNTKVEELERKLADANALAVQAKREASALQKELEEVKSSQSSSGAVDTSGISEREMEMLQKHKALLESMMRDYQGLGEGASAAAPVPVAPVVASSSEAKQTFVSNDLLEQAETVVMQVLAAKTGYEPDMIEADMELETELGIDSIKRVEILSEVQAQLNVEAKDVDALSRTRTVGEVVDAMKAEIRGSSSPAPVGIQVSTPPQQADASLLAKAETVVMDVLAAKTGYEPDMIEADMELETELGIDSIKRVEILSEVQAQLNVEAKDVDALSRTRTVGEVVDAMKAEISGAAPVAQVAAPASPAPKLIPIAPTPVVAVDNSVLARAETVVMEVLAAKTGYEPDMIEADMELETELGIDSIKRVEILSEVQAQLNVEAKDVDALSRTRTVGEVVDAMKAEIRGSSGPVAAAPVVAAAAPVAVAASGSVDPALLAKAETVVMEVLAAKTGYEPDMIEEDMELETELGIDSIKRVEILSEVQAQLNVEAKDVDALSRTRTVGEVVEAMKAEIRGGSPSGPVKVSTVGFTDVRGAECEDLTICSSKSVVIGRAAKLDLDAPINRPVVIVSDGSALTDAIAVEVGARAVVLAIGNHSGVACSRKVQVADFSEAALVKALAEVESKYGVIGGFIYQHSKSTELDVQLGWAMLAAKNVSKSLKQPIQNGRTFFLGVARLDGELGLAASKKASLTDALQFAQRGAVFGLCKSIDLEWRDVFCRGVDVAANMGAADAAKSIVAEFSCPNVGIREVGYTADGTRHTTHASDLLVGTPRGQAITKEDAFIVTGGARGITPLCIREISKRVGGGTYVLLGRSKLIDEPAWAKGKEGKELEKAGLMFLKEEFKAGRGPKPTPMVHKKLVGSVAGAQEVRSSIANIEAQGGRAIYVSCDVSSVDTVKATVADLERKHSLNFTGLVHASGVLRDKLVENKKLEEFEAVYGTKVNGLVNILSALDVSNLKHMVFFSSLAGFHGNVGQSDYAMANEALNKIGFQLASNFPQLCIKSICFGPWDGGMVTPQLKKQFQSMGVQIIPREGGAETVSKIVIGSEPLQVLVGNWGVPPAKPLQKANTITITLTPEHNPFLVDHRIQGKNVLPMTVAVGYLAHLAKGLYAGHYLWAVEDAQLFKGVTIDQAVDCQVSIVEKNEEDGKIKVEAVLKSSGNGKWVPAYQAIIVLGSKPRPGMVLNSQDMNLEADPATEKSAASVYNGTTLFHGPAFQGIEHVLNYNDKRFTAKCRSVPLSGAQRGDFTTDAPQDPFVADISFQAMLVWARMLRNSGALPNNIERFDFHKEIPAGTSYYTTIEPSTSGGLPDRIWKCKFSMHDEQGEVFLSGRSSVVLNKNLKF